MFRRIGEYISLDLFYFTTFFVVVVVVVVVVFCLYRFFTCHASIWTFSFLASRGWLILTSDVALSCFTNSR